MQKIQTLKNIAINVYFKYNKQYIKTIAISIFKLKNIFNCIEGSIFIKNILFPSFINLNKIY